MKMLFLCVANSARSQIAEGLAKALLGPSHDVQSAGSDPSGKVQPWALKVLEEKGIDTASLSSKGVTDLPEEFLNRLDFVITLCAEEICPHLPSNAVRLHWPIPDPASVPEAEKPSAFRSARDAIQARLDVFIREGKITRG